MYATVDEIKASSTRVPQVLEATPSDIQGWMEEAAEAIHTFCSQNFSFEPNVSKRVMLSGEGWAVLPGYLSGKVYATVDGGDRVSSADLEYEAGGLSIHYLGSTVSDWSTQYRRAPQFLEVTGDWGYAPSTEFLVVAYANDLKAKYTAHRLDTEAHLAADTTNTILSADATNTSTALTLLNELKDALTAHFSDTSVHSVADSNVPVSASATDERSAIALARVLETAWDSHLDNGSSHESLPPESQRTTVSVDALVMPRNLKRVFIRLVKRIAVRDDEEDNYNRDIGYQSEKTGDGYDYDLTNGTLRNLIRPEDFQVLHYYVNDGVVVA